MTRPGRTLLLIDDDRNQLDLREIILEMSGHEVLAATNARYGMQLFGAHAADAVSSRRRGRQVLLAASARESEVERLPWAGNGPGKDGLRPDYGFSALVAVLSG